MTLIIEIGLLYAIISVGILIAFRIVGFSDLTGDGSFVLGASVFVTCQNASGNTPLSLACSITSGMLSGILTSFIHSRLAISQLMSGVITSLACYSISLRIAGRPNVVVDLGSKFSPSKTEELITAFSLPLSVCTLATVLFGVFAILSTNSGLLLRLCGDSKTSLEALGYNRKHLYLFGLILSNGTIGLAGAVVCLQQRFFDVSMGHGIVVIALAALIIGESIIYPTKIVGLLLSAPLGMILYQGAIFVALRMGLAPSDLKLLTAGCVLTVFIIAGYRQGVGSAERRIGCRDL